MDRKDEKFIKDFEKKVKDTIDNYRLATKKDKIIVACSGGKDSTSVLYLLHKFGYNVEGLIIDLYIGKWSKDNLDNVKRYCKELGVKLNIISMREMFGSSICYIRSNIQTKVNLKNCAICGVIKRWLLNKTSREMKGTKLATGHNLDDQIETLMMNMVKGNPELSLGQAPKTGVIKDKKFVERIKPLYFCTNAEVRRYSELKGFPVLYDPCPCSLTAFRRRVRQFIKELETEHKDIKLKTVKGFLKQLPELKRRYACKEMGNKKETKNRLNYCEICGEPSRNAVCKTCELITILRSEIVKK